MGTEHFNGVYAAISQVQGALAKDGISKSRKNQQQGYSFRGIDDVYNALSALLAEHRLCIIPRYLSRTLTEREAKSGGVLFNVVVEAEFDLVGPDGSKHTARNYGEAMDSADKATNKAMSAAYKNMALQVFAIPTEGDNDADAATPEVRAVPKQVANPDRSEAFKMREAFAGIKSDLKRITGSDALYYKILGGHGFEKSTQIIDRAKGASIYGEMRAAFKDAMDAATTGKDHITDEDLPENLRQPQEVA
jgi:hypothetical protein